MATATKESIRAKVTGRGIPLPGDDIDTDRIIPARFLKLITFETLGQYAFYDVRFDEKGNKKDHPLNDPRFAGGNILIVNRNFGCGSSREHAPQSLMRMGIAAFVGESFAEIFSGNCTALGLPAVRVSHEDAQKLQALVNGNPAIAVVIDLPSSSITAGTARFSFTMPESDKQALVTGAWDTTAVLLANAAGIRATAERLPYVNGFDRE